jgi:UMF1 family MFS transporter
MVTGNYRKRFLLALAWIGATACMLFIFVSPSVYLFAPILVMISVCCLGNGFALLNSFLPVLVANHSGIFETERYSEWQPVSTGDADTALSGLSLSNKFSAKGIGYGYAAAVFVQILAIGILVLMGQLHLSSSATLPMRVVLLLVGAWWAAFTIPTYLWLRPRPGPRLQGIPVTIRRWQRPFYYIAFAWRSLFATIKTALKLKQVCIFLVAWFLMSDAIATISGVAILFARTELHMETPAIALVSITATLSGVLGATLWPKIQKYFNMETNRVIIACICLSEIIPLYGLLGFVLPVLGLRSQWEIFPMAVIHGSVMGGLSSYCRSFYGVLIPPGSEAAFYALYAVTDKGSSVIGPAVVGKIVDATGSVRMGFWFLAVLVVLPLPLIWWVDAESGRRDAQRLAGAKDVEDEEEHIPLADGMGRRSLDDVNEDEVFGLADSDDELDYLPTRQQ